MAEKIRRLARRRKIGMLILVVALLMVGCNNGAIVNEEMSDNGTNTQVAEPKESIQTENQSVSKGEIVKDQYLALFSDYLSQIQTVTTVTPSAETDQEKIVNNMLQLVRQGGSSEEVHKLYLDGITQLSEKQADVFTSYAIAGLQKNLVENDYSDEIYQYEWQSDVYDAFWDEADKYNRSFVQLNKNIESINDKKLQSLVRDAEVQGYYISSSEGSLYHMVDFTVFANYRSYNSQAMADLLVILAIENIEPSASDAALIVDLEVMAARAYGIEQMLQNYQGSEYEKYIVVNYINTIETLLYGMNNTPNFSYDDNRINESTIDIYKRVSSLEGSYLGELISEFMRALDDNEGIYNDNVYEVAHKLIAKTYEKFGMSEDFREAYWGWLSGNAMY